MTESVRVAFRPIDTSLFAQISQHTCHASCAHLCSITIDTDIAAFAFGLLLYLLGEEKLSIL